MSYDSDALAGLDEFLGRILASLTPAQRRRAALKLGQALRRSNLARIAANVEPDGGAMEARKARRDRRGRLRRKAGGKMFARLRYARNFRIEARSDSVEIAPAGAIARLAAVHHFGEEDMVGRLRDGRVIRTRYPARRLLGFSREDQTLALDIAAGLLDPSR